MSDDCKAAMLEAGVPYPCAPDCRCALEIENKALRAERDTLKADLANAVQAMNQSRLAFEGYVSKRSATDMLDNLLAKLHSRNERNAG